MATKTSVFSKVDLGLSAAVLVGVFQLINAVRAMADPIGFASYMGLALHASNDTGFVLIYALRTGFIGAVVLYLCFVKNLSALSWLALLAIALPVGDALLAQLGGASAGTIARHLAIGVFLVATFALLRRPISKQKVHFA